MPAEGHGRSALKVEAPGIGGASSDTEAAAGAAVREDVHTLPRDDLDGRGAHGAGLRALYAGDDPGGEARFGVPNRPPHPPVLVKEKRLVGAGLDALEAKSAGPQVWSDDRSALPHEGLMRGHDDLFRAGLPAEVAARASREKLWFERGAGGAEEGERDAPRGGARSPSEGPGGLRPRIHEEEPAQKAGPVHLLAHGVIMGPRFGTRNLRPRPMEGGRGVEGIRRIRFPDAFRSSGRLEGGAPFDPHLA